MASAIAAKTPANSDAPITTLTDSPCDDPTSAIAAAPTAKTAGITAACVECPFFVALTAGPGVAATRAAPGAGPHLSPSHQYFPSAEYCGGADRTLGVAAAQPPPETYFEAGAATSMWPQAVQKRTSGATTAPQLGQKPAAMRLPAQAALGEVCTRCLVQSERRRV